MSLADIIEREARLIILRSLAAEPNQSAMASVLREVLAVRWAIQRSPEWVREQLAFLAELRAIRVIDLGETQIAELLERGREHLARRTTIEGVKRAPDEAW